MKIPRYQDFLEELASGSKYGVFIDDTGSPGLQSTPPNLHPERKSWIGVVVHPDQMPEVLEQFPEALEELRHQIGAKEFHFADIYAGKGDFEGVDLQVRLRLFEFMAHIFRVYQFPIFVQTFDPNTLENIRSKRDLPKKIGIFDLTKQEDAALLFSLIRIKWYIEKHRTDARIVARVFVDEGCKRHGIAIPIHAWKPVFADGLICFARSSSIPPIQLADFAAFALNRTQLLLGKEKLSPLDKRLLEILSSIAWNYQNIPKRIIKFKRTCSRETSRNNS
ncbi:MAG: DUF3800 domain-containing protein [Candidatus Bathyarchaeia archaeon]|jgi:hypothetical protein